MRKLLDHYLWRSYRQMSAISNWLRRRFTPAGKLVLVVLFVSALVGIDIRVVQSYQLFSISLVFIVIAVISNMTKKSNFLVSRRMPKYASVGEAVTYQLTIQNKANKKITQLAVLDIAADPRPTKEEFFIEQEPKKSSNNLFDRFFRYPRWKWLTHKNTIATTSITTVTTMLPGTELKVWLKLMPIRRGIIQLESVDIYQLDSIGLYRARKKISCYHSLVVLPKRYKVPAIKLSGKRLHNPGGVSNASSIGDAQEFVSLREYRPGDSIRRIHWNSWAKTNQPVVKEYQEEYFSRYGLILDTFCNNEKIEQFEEAVSLAASFVYSLHTLESFIDLMFVTNKAYQLSTGRGITQREHLLEVLALVRMSDKNNFIKLSAKIADNLTLLSGAIIIFVDWDEQRRQLLKQLQNAQIPYQVFLIQSARELTDSLSDLDSNITILHAGNINEGLALL